MQGPVQIQCPKCQSQFALTEVPVKRKRRLLFTHPTHALWWVLPNFEKYPDDIPITGVLCIYADRGDTYTPEVSAEIAKRCAKLGIEYIPGGRMTYHSASEYLRVPTAEWQREQYDDLMEMNGADKAIAIDVEPYSKRPLGAPKYHSMDLLDQFEMACEFWSDYFGDAYLYGPPEVITQNRAIANRTGGKVFSLDGRSYDTAHRSGMSAFSAQVLSAKTWCTEFGISHITGLYLKYIRDDAVMASVDDAWFFARTTPDHPDDLPDFGTPEWSPRR